ncbi:hypothetical protein RHS04_06275 [Rhizoctonia solani]|uniref:Metallo-beta-lactamase domain-containing protein n=1 Tax=Rhizoctonia solani TaxID=456999 RepID=A0A8H7H871_9AGAM|nr:hypothetical protein RHS04_06275 [Rhizoctonia solani]
MPAKLIVVYAGYGDTILIEDNDTDPKSPGCWLIDGGPVTAMPGQGEALDGSPGKHGYQAYYQFLRAAVRRFCSSDGGKTIDRLKGIIVTHPDRDHMDGIIQLIADWLPDKPENVSVDKPLKFQGPVIVNDIFINSPNAHYLVLKNLLKTKNFKAEKLAVGDPAVPAAMSNESPSDLWKMIYQAPAAISRRALTVDQSVTNISSIITTWDDKVNPRIVTTGDSIGSLVLGCVDKLPDKATLGIFKIPHHGSQRNSQIDDSFDVSSTASAREANHYFFLSLICWYLYPKVAPGVDQDLFKNIMDDTLDNCSDAWIGEMTRKDPVGIYSRGGFSSEMDTTSALFRIYIANQKFVYTSDTGRLDLSNDADLQKFAVLLADRHNQLLASIYTSKPDDTAKLRQKNFLKGALKPSFTYDQSNANYNFISTVTEERYVREFSKKLRIEVPRPECLALLSSLYDDPSAGIQYQMGIIAFYSRFRWVYFSRWRWRRWLTASSSATNYVISANGAHEHPHPHLIGALIVSAIDRGTPCRLFITESGKVEVDRVCNIVTNLLTMRPGVAIPAAQWKNFIRIYYLDTDYCATIPLDTSAVAGCKELELDGVDSKQSRALLYKQFNQNDAYNVPRAAEPPTSSFELYATDLPGPVLTTIRVGYSQKTNLFTLNDATKTCFRLAVDPAGAAPALSLNKALYHLTAVDPDDLPAAPVVAGAPPPTIVYDIPTNIAFRRPSKGSPEFRVFDETGKLALSYDKDALGNNILTFQDTTVLPVPTIAHLRFQRTDGFHCGKSRPSLKCQVPLHFPAVALALPGRVGIQS